MIKVVRKTLAKPLALLIVGQLCIEMLLPLRAFALTGGPAQPEASTFEPAGTSEMVDLATGDFKYNIPLMDVEGYPLNLSYRAGVGMEDEASWVGLGWTLNPGAINRDVRGIPDDFNGEAIVKETNFKDNTNFGINVSGTPEFFGKLVRGKLKLKSKEELEADWTNYVKGLMAPPDPSNKTSLKLNFSISVGVSFSNYNGLGLQVGMQPSIAIEKSTSKHNHAFSSGFDFTASNKNGIELTPNASFSNKIVNRERLSNGSAGFNVSLPYNSRQGLRSISYGLHYSRARLSTLTRKPNPRSVSGQFLFGTPTYTPYPSPSTQTQGFTFSDNVGGELFGIKGNVGISGFWTNQALEKKAKTLYTPAFGYCNLHRADQESLLDFNREKDAPYHEGVKQLPLAQLTFDQYTVSAEGLQTNIRPYRNDVGAAWDPSSESISSQGALGAEFGAGNLIKAGLNIGATNTNSFARAWQDGAQDVTQHIKYRNPTDKPGREPYYFKSPGEIHGLSNPIYHNMVGDAAIVPELYKKDVNIARENRLILKDNFLYEGGSRPIAGSEMELHARGYRKQTITVLTAAEALYLGTVKLESYDNLYWDNYYQQNKFSVDRHRYGPEDNENPGYLYGPKKHHFSEWNITRADGTRYVYSVPAYNFRQEEVTFNINHDIEGTEVGYGFGENSIHNTNGIDHYFSKTTTPAFVHTYYLSAVLSPDYADVRGDGITDDDYGNFTKFNYRRVYTHLNPYKWRTPYGPLKARNDQGLLSNLEDQKAHYTYGEKELWYLHSVESKNYVAIFHISEREDGLGVLGPNGGKDVSQRLYKLDSISLYLKEEKIRLGNAAAPLQRVHFEYDYSLCPNVHNNTEASVMVGDININAGKGKLTLKKIYYTYGNSARGKLNSYSFYYGDSNHDRETEEQFNPAYNPTSLDASSDRWGNYHKSPSGYSVVEWPYTRQDFNNAQQMWQAGMSAWCWTLSTIDLPSGGTIKINYEADDYAYVQDKEAMMMVSIVGVRESLQENIQKGLYRKLTSLGDDDFSEHLYVAVQYPYALSSTAELKKSLEGTRELYYKVKLKLRGKNGRDFYDWVWGYSEIDHNSCELDASDHSKAYIKLKPAYLRDDGGGPEVHPFSKSGWQFIKMQNPRLVYEGGHPSMSGTAALKGLMSAFTVDIPVMVQGFNRIMRKRGYANELDKGMLRVPVPNRSKKGGGSRVKSILMSDNWADMIGSGFSEEYGQEYDYTIIENGKKGSSGVAAYEPMIGNEENPLRQTISYTFARPLGTNETLYHEGPFGESFMPAPTVIYRQVKVKAHKPTGHESSLANTASGCTVHEFYTAKDFPVKFDQTRIYKVKERLPLLPIPLYKETFRREAVAQGYSIVANDMHGKQKAVWHLSEALSGAASDFSAWAESGEEYFYDEDNKLPFMEKNGKLISGTSTAGVEVDAVLDLRETYSQTRSWGLQINADLFFIGFIPIGIPMPWGERVISEEVFRSAVFTKAVSKTGVLCKLKKWVNGSSTSTEYLAWDKYTGEVLAQKTYNEYNDAVSSFTYPAHWAYPRMGLSYQNEGGVLKDVQVTSNGRLLPNFGTPSTHALADYLFPGDEIALGNYDNQKLMLLENVRQRYWVHEYEGNLYLLDAKGYLATPKLSHGDTVNKWDLKVLRSGYRNRPQEPIGSFVAKGNLFSGENLSFNNVINASAVVYEEKWQTLCCGARPESLTATTSLKEAICDEVNPYLKNILGQSRIKTSYYFHGSRSSFGPTTPLRNAGPLASFTPFWQYIDSEWQPNLENDKWRWASTVTMFSPSGFPVEEMDTLHRKNTMIYGFRERLPVATASNAGYRDIAFESFEDAYYGNPVTPPSFSFKNRFVRYPGHMYAEQYFYNANTRIVDTGDAHTGKYCLLVPVGSEERIERSYLVENPQTDTTYRLRQADCLGQFLPERGKRYLFSAWVKVPGQGSVESYSEVSVQVATATGSTNHPVETFLPSGPIIEGWQKVEGYFYLRPDITTLKIKLVAPSGHDARFDDIRAMPADANMKTYVYEQTTLRLSAILDENHYATFFEYNAQGELARTKKETHRGIFTVQEHHKHLQKKTQ